jgi:hypothetical protein
MQAFDRTSFEKSKLFVTAENSRIFINSEIMKAKNYQKA